MSVDLKPATGFLAHVELIGLFDAYVIPIPEGTRIQFYAGTKTEKNFSTYLAKRFQHLGEPADCVYREEFRCYDVTFRGLRFKDPEEALVALTRSVR
jgi:hypothetical protein